MRGKTYSWMLFDEFATIQEPEMFANVTIGADPELFLKDADGHYKSAIGRIGGTKAEPKPMEGLPPGFFIQEDNVAAEFNIPPAATFQEFAQSITKSLKYISSVTRPQKLKLDISPVAYFPPTELLHPKALELGCDPDFCVWTKSPNPRPVAPPALRTAAGHIHVGWKDPTEAQQELIIKLMDLHLSVPLVLQTKQNERRTLYGRAGAFRFKPYGVEYRTMDNTWLTQKATQKWFFTTICEKIITEAKNMLRSPNSIKNMELIEFGDLIQSAINTHNRDEAMFLMDTFALTSAPDPQIKQTAAAKSKKTIDQNVPF